MRLPVFLNGEWIDEANGAALRCDDPAIGQGVMLVETVRTYGRQVFEVHRHRSRLEAGLDAFGLPRQPRGLDLLTLPQEVVSRLPGDDDVAVAVVVSPGPSGAEPTVLAHARDLPHQTYRRWTHDGLSLVVTATSQAAGLPRTFKHRSRLNWWLADREAKAITPQAMAWLPDVDGVLTETAAGNVLAVRGDTLLEMPRHRVVPGVTAAIVRELAAECGRPIETAELRPDDLASVDELLMTSTGCGLVPIASVRSSAGLLWTGSHRAVFNELTAAWSARFGHPPN